MKEKISYVPADFELVLLTASDVITTSGGSAGNVWSPDNKEEIEGGVSGDTWMP